MRAQACETARHVSPSPACETCRLNRAPLKSGDITMVGDIPADETVDNGLLVGPAPP